MAAYYKLRGTHR